MGGIKNEIDVINGIIIVEKFSLSGMMWEEVVVMNELRYVVFGVVMNGKIYIVGGL